MPAPIGGPQTRWFYIGVIDPIVEERIVAQLAPFGSVVALRDLCRGGSAPPFRGRSDVVIVSPCILRGARVGGWPRLIRFFDQAHVMVMSRDNDVCSHRDLLKLADGWILGETQLDNLVHAIELSTHGHQPFPLALWSAPAGISASRERIWSLSERELSLLAEARRRRLAGKTPSR